MVNLESLIKKYYIYKYKKNLSCEIWMKEILNTNKQHSFIVVDPMELNRLLGIKDNISRLFFKKYKIDAIIGLSNVIRENPNSLILLKLIKNEQKDKILIFNYLKLIRLKSNVIKTNQFTPLEYYPTTFKKYCEMIEAWINENLEFKNTEYCTSYFCDSSELRFHYLKPELYTKEACFIRRNLNKKNLCELQDIATILKPTFISNESVYTISRKKQRNNWKYDIELSSEKTDIKLQIGDIVIKNSYLTKVYFINNLPKKNIYPTTNDIVIRPHDIEKMYFIFLYLISKTGKTILNCNSSGGILNIINYEGLKQLPVIIQTRSNDYYKDAFNTLYNEYTEISKYSFCLQKAPNYEESNNIEELLCSEFLENAKLHKGESLKKMLRLDLKEVNSCYNSKAYKATMILCGSILEALLIDWISEYYNTDYFKKTLYVIRDGKRKRADLVDYINEIGEINKPSWKEKDYADIIRNKRNLVHAKLCIVNPTITENDCRQIIEYLKLIIKSRGIKLD